METKWIKLSGVVSYKIHGQHITIRGESPVEILDRGSGGTVYSTLPDALASNLLAMRDLEESNFVSAVEFVGHTIMNYHGLASGALLVMLKSPEHAPMLQVLMATNTINTVNLLSAFIGTMGLADDIRIQLTKDQERLRKLFGEHD